MRNSVLLGDGNVNIANFGLGRTQPSGEAIGLVNVDNPVPSEVLAEIRSIPAVHTAKIVEID